MVTYGHQVTSEDDRYVKLADDVRKQAEQLPPGTALVDTFPICSSIMLYMICRLIIL
jgi:hypothetical protein